MDMVNIQNQVIPFIFGAITFIILSCMHKQKKDKKNKKDNKINEHFYLSMTVQKKRIRLKLKLSRVLIYSIRYDQFEIHSNLLLFLEYMFFYTDHWL